MKVHYTGFEPWGDITYNPSWDVASSAAEISGSSAQLLPVSFDVVDFKFDGFVVHFGVATKREFVELERYGHNIKLDQQTSNSSIPVSRRLFETGEIAYETNLDISQHLQDLSMNISEWNFRESRDAGTFVCNALYYISLSENLNRIFIHVPMMDSFSAKALGKQIGLHFDRVSF